MPHQKKAGAEIQAVGRKQQRDKQAGTAKHEPCFWSFRFVSTADRREKA